MPNSISLGAFVLGAVLLLIAIVGGGFKIFGVEVSSKAGTAPRVVSLVLGIGLVVAGFVLDGSNLPEAATPKTSLVASAQNPAGATENKSPDGDLSRWSSFLYRAMDEDYKGEFRRQDEGWIEFNKDNPRGRKWRVQPAAKGSRIRLVDEDAIIEIDPAEKRIYYTASGNPGYPVPEPLYVIFDAR